MNNSRPGILIYDIDPDMDTRTDELAFGFMTYDRDGVLVRLDSSISTDFIEIKLVSKK